MLHIIQVVVSGFAELPILFLDEAKAESAYLEAAKRYWPQFYSEYCDQNGISQDSLSSAKSFSKSFGLTEKSRINHWVVKPEDIGLDKLSLLLLGDESLQEQRKLIQSLSDDVERKSLAIKKELSELCGKVADLVESVNGFDMLNAVDQSVSGPSELTLGSSTPLQEEPEEIDKKYATPEWQQFVGSIKNLCGGSWSEFPLFTRHDWRQEVYSNLTSFEYWEWAASKIDECIGKSEKAGYNVFDDADKPGQYRFNTPDGIGSEISCPSEVEAWCQACLHLDASKSQG